MQRNWTMLFALLGVSAVFCAGVLVIAAWFLGSPAKGFDLAQAAGIPRPAVIAHRGASYLAPEATRAAYLLAGELGADYLEVDLRRTRDGILIAHHDSTLLRMSNVEKVYPGRTHMTVDTFSFGELQELDMGEWFNRRFPDRARKTFEALRILRFEEILEIAERAPHEVGVIIEIKEAGMFPGIESQVVETLRTRGWLDRPLQPGHSMLIFQSFEPDSLKRFQLLAPAVPRILLIEETFVEKVGWTGILRTSAELAQGVGAWGYRRALSRHWSESVGWRYVMTWPWHIGEAHRRGLLVIPWTIDDAVEMWMLRLGGADGIFTNRPELALTLYGRAPRTDLTSLWEKIQY
jgi:glycerophosphoryl diester phosphodiesterase